MSAAAAAYALAQMGKGIFAIELNYGAVVSDFCPNCEHRTSLKRDDLRQIWPASLALGQFYPHAPSRPSVIEELWQCDYCKAISVVWFETDNDGTTTARLACPVRRPRKLPVEVPEAIRSLYEEASVAEFGGALRGAAGLYRASVDVLTRDQGFGVGDLNGRINKLRDKGVSDDLIRDLHEARVTGNWSLHEGLEFASDEVADVAVLIAHAVDELYVQPARKEELRAKRAARRDASRQEAPSTGGEPPAP